MSYSTSYNKAGICWNGSPVLHSFSCVWFAKYVSYAGQTRQNWTDISASDCCFMTWLCCVNEPLEINANYSVLPDDGRRKSVETRLISGYGVGLLYSWYQVNLVNAVPTSSRSMLIFYRLSLGLSSGLFLSSFPQIFMHLPSSPCVPHAPSISFVSCSSIFEWQ